MVEVSLALKLTALTVLCPLLLPLIKALTLVFTWFSALTPAPLRPIPATPPPVTAKEPATTVAEIVALDVAVCRRLLAVTLEL